MRRSGPVSGFVSRLVVHGRRALGRGAGRLRDLRNLDAAGIDLMQKISIEITNATVDQLFEELCKPVGLGFEIRDETVFLAPAE